MADLSKATSRPWRYVDGYVWNGESPTGMPLRLIPAYKEFAADKWREEAEANAALIVKCANLHDELVAALREAEESVAVTVRELGLRPDGPNAQALVQIRAALAKAEAE